MDSSLGQHTDSNLESIENRPLLDPKRTLAAITELNIVRKNIQIYPLAHVQVKQSIEKAFKILGNALEIDPQITIGVAKDTLLVGNIDLDSKNRVSHELALALRRLGVAAVSFYRGMGKNELVGFVQWLRHTEKPGQDKKKENSECHKEPRFPHIRIQMVDYSRFHATEEDEITREPGDKEQHTRGSIWHGFISNLMAGTLSDSDQDISANGLDSTNPSIVARFLNENRIDPQKTLETYRNFVTAQINPTSAWDYYQYDNAGGQLTKSFNILIEELNPKLRQQFLSTTFQLCEPHSEAPATHEFLKGFSSTLVIEMLRQANAEGHEISPSLMNFVQQISNTQNQKRLQNLEAESSQMPDPDIATDSFQTLFKPEKKDRYATVDYDAMLKEFVNNPAAISEPVTKDFPLDVHLETLKDCNLNIQIARLVLAFMNAGISIEEYHVCAGKLIEIAYELVETGNFNLLLTMYNVLEKHRKGKPDPEIQRIATETLEHFREPQFTYKAVSTFQDSCKRDDPTATNFLVALVPHVIPDVLNAFAKEENPDLNGPLFSLLKRFRPSAINEALRRLRDSRTAFVCNLVVLLRALNAHQTISKLRPLLEHPDHNVQMEALATLMKFGDEYALPYARRALHSGRQEVVTQIIAAATQYRVFWVVPELVAMVKRLVVFRSDYRRNIELIRALGRIGDSNSIPMLKRLAKASWSLYPRELEQMQEALFQSLDGYQYHHIEELLKIGFHSRNENIRRTCQAMSTTQDQLSME